MAMVMSSTAFGEGQPIPVRHAGDGDDVSPELRWDGVPQGAVELAMICDDPDAPTPQPWVHWVIYGLSPQTASLPEGIERVESPPQVSGATQGANGWPAENLGYRGPAPPPGHGVHHYHFRLYALDATLDLEPGIDKTGLLAAMEGHVLAEAEVVGTYER